MQIRVGLKAGDLVHPTHRVVELSSDSAMRALCGNDSVTYPVGTRLVITAQSGQVLLNGKPSGPSVIIMSTANSGNLSVASHASVGLSAKPKYSYVGKLEVVATVNNLKLVLETDLENYVQGVLQSEIPAYFNLEAMKAQAVIARNNGINPRLSHQAEGFDVCDSFLHCQAFYGVRQLSQAQSQAIAATKNQVLLHDGRPALALFSACGGGHTEDYQNCFSDPITNEFPPKPISYLRGVSEGKLPLSYPAETGLRELYLEPAPKTDDAWSMTSFRWTVHFSADALEAHMHHVLEKMQKDPLWAPFIKAPSTGKFGHIQGFEISGRGVAGTALAVLIRTSEGIWRIEKELTIRSVFENPDLKLKRLKSARMFFDETHDSLGLLSGLTVKGFGNGHGVGLQQVGAQGLASKGLDYRKILEHYYRGTSIGTV